MANIPTAPVTQEDANLPIPSVTTAAESFVADLAERADQDMTKEEKRATMISAMKWYIASQLAMVKVASRIPGAADQIPRALKGESCLNGTSCSNTDNIARLV
jgi:hypothetical protein